MLVFMIDEVLRSAETFKVHVWASQACSNEDLTSTHWGLVKQPYYRHDLVAWDFYS